MLLFLVPTALLRTTNHRTLPVQAVRARAAKARLVSALTRDEGAKADPGLLTSPGSTNRKWRKPSCGEPGLLSVCFRSVAMLHFSGLYSPLALLASFPLRFGRCTLRGGDSVGVYLEH